METPEDGSEPTTTDLLVYLVLCLQRFAHSSFFPFFCVVVVLCLCLCSVVGLYRKRGKRERWGKKGTQCVAEY